MSAWFVAAGQSAGLPASLERPSHRHRYRRSGDADARCLTIRIEQVLQRRDLAYFSCEVWERGARGERGSRNEWRCAGKCHSLPLSFYLSLTQSSLSILFSHRSLFLALPIFESQSASDSCFFFLLQDPRCPSQCNADFTPKATPPKLRQIFQKDVIFLRAKERIALGN